ncbi:unnamed protein product, partial [Heligmosomoides polygyrus]|uniref:DUF5641 domain-containing protein n=1 Tax=Heligmosomoides polygyrus TaxID=6339 RepID=A0A183GVX3_HELPZ
MAKILGEEKDIDVRILLDTGSELSFIDTQLIKDLNLPVVGKTKLKIRTFGQTTVEEIQYPVTQVLLEDKLGKVHELRLYGSKTIASKVKRPILSEDDWLFIKERGLDLTEAEVEESQPRILLGCDLLWDFVNGLKVKLPSGIYAISTLFGYMLSGSQSSQNSSTKERQVMCTSNLSEEAELWDTYWKMDSRVDKFWTAWQDYYLKELREFHKKNLQEGKTSSKTPSPGEVVLVSSSILPRNSWKLGRILDVVRSEDGQIREAELRIGGGGTIRRPPNLLIPLEIRQETGQRSEDNPLEEEILEREVPERRREVPDRQDQTYNLRPQRRPRYPFDEAEYEVYQLQIIEESEKNCAEKIIAGTADNLKSVASSASSSVRVPSTFFRMADEDLKKCVPVSDDEEQEDLLDLGDFDEEEEREDSPTDESEGQESEEGDEKEEPPVDEPEEIEEEEEEKEEARPLTRNDLVSFGVRTLKLVQNIGTRQQVLLESLKEQTEDRLNRIEKKLTAYQMRTEYMLSVLMYGEEDETESVTDQP